MNTLYKYKFWRPLLFLMLLISLSACQDQAHSDDTDGVMFTEEQKETIRQEREQLAEFLDKELKAADQELEQLNTMMLQEGAMAAEELDEQYGDLLMELRTYKSDLEAKVQEVKETTDEGWEKFKSEMDPYLTKVETDLDTLSSRLQTIMKESK